MAPEVIACDENPDATYDNRVSRNILGCYLCTLQKIWTHIVADCEKGE